MSMSVGPVKGAHLKGQTLRIGGVGEHAALLQCDLRDCHVVVDGSEGHSYIYESVLDGCRVEYKRRLKDARIFSNAFHRCEFVGSFEGVDFGRSPLPDPLTTKPDELGAIVLCDFSRARLDWCRFFEVDVSSQNFAPWPQFVLLHKNRLEAAQSGQNWPGELARFLALSENARPSLSAVACLAGSIQDRFGVTEDELLAALRSMGGVVNGSLE